MPWFLVDDHFYSHPRAMAALAIDPASLGLWVAAGSWSSDHTTDGVIQDDVLPFLFPGAADLAVVLVTAKLWRRGKGVHRIVQGAGLCKIQDSRVVKAARDAGARRQAIFRDPELKEAVRARDGSRCRYCARPVRWGKGRALDSATYSHIDPKDGNTLSNIVTACLECNTHKGARTLAEAGMKLVSPAQQPSGNASRNGTTGESRGSPDSGSDSGKTPYPLHVRPYDRQGAADRLPSARTVAEATADATRRIP